MSRHLRPLIDARRGLPDELAAAKAVAASAAIFAGMAGILAGAYFAWNMDDAVLWTAITVGACAGAFGVWGAVYGLYRAWGLVRPLRRLAGGLLGAYLGLLVGCLLAGALVTPWGMLALPIATVIGLAWPVPRLGPRGL